MVETDYLISLTVAANALQTKQQLDHEEEELEMDDEEEEIERREREREREKARKMETPKRKPQLRIGHFSFLFTSSILFE